MKHKISERQTMRIQALNVAANKSDQMVSFKIYIGTTSIQVWEEAKERMERKHGHRDVVCWEIANYWQTMNTLEPLHRFSTHETTTCKCCPKQ